jgi:hypothetical protein
MKHWHILFIWILPMIGWWTPAIGQNIVDDFPKAIQQLSSQPENVDFTNTILFDGTGGHLQGIQLHKEMDQIFAFISGSSATKSYMVKVGLDPPAKVIAIDELMSEPYRHAGGFQIFDNYLAVGIEDNYKRTSSLIKIYNISGSKNDWSQPFYTIYRTGEFERSTAGAVGMTQYNGEVLLAVANWNSINIDFYACPSADFYSGEGEFHQIATLTPLEVSTLNWSDPAWWSYQNINLFTDAKEGLYLVGFARDDNDQHLADVFRVSFADRIPESESDMNQKKDIQIQKILTKSFERIGKTDFRAGAGLSIIEGTLIMGSIPYAIESNTSLNFFR